VELLDQEPMLTFSLARSGASPQVIGEASILMAQTCFPNEGLSGNMGHVPIDVLCKISSPLWFIYLLKHLFWL
jgi:Fungal chitosanase of glycosyl hydrolase group 75